MSKHSFGRDLSRRHLLKLAGGLSALALVPQAYAQASSWKPSKPVTIIVPYPPGGTIDVMARLAAPGLSERLGQPVVVENRAGANGSIGATAVYTAAPDGTTLLAGVPDPLTLFPVLASVPYDPQKFIPLGEMGSVALAMFARPDLPADNLAQLLELSKKQRLSYSSAGVGGTAHLLMVMYQRAVGIDVNSLLHVPYPGMAPALQAVMAKQVDLLLITIGGRTIESDKYKVLGITSAERLPALPSVPTFAEQGVPVINENFHGFFAPPETPEEISSALAAAISEVASTPDFKEQMVKLSITPAARSRTEFSDFYQAELKRWSDLIKEADIKLNQ